MRFGGSQILEAMEDSIFGTDKMLTEDDITINAILENNVLHQIFKWHNVMVYAPENLAFVDKVRQVWYPMFLHQDAEQAQVLGVSSMIVKQFLSPESSWEITLPAKMKKDILTVFESGNVDQDLFTPAYNFVLREMSRSLPQFVATKIFKSFEEHQHALESMNTRRRRSRSLSIVGEDAGISQIMMEVRQVYDTTHPVALERTFDVSSKFSYKVNVEGNQVGFAVARKMWFYFYDMEEEELIKVPTSALAGKPLARKQSAPGGQMTGAKGKPLKRTSTESKLEQGTRPRRQSIAERRAARKASRTSVDEGRSRRGSAPDTPERKSKSRLRKKLQRQQSAPIMEEAKKKVSAVESLLVHTRDQIGDVFGPFDMTTLRLWWKYHLLPPNIDVSIDDASTWKPLKTMLDVFELSPDGQISLLDPTFVETSVF